MDSLILTGTVARALLGRRLAPLETGVVPLRVWPADVDINWHMNNARYLRAMDLGRWDLLLRMGARGTVWSEGWRPIVGEARLRFRRQLRPLERYELHSRVCHWDAKWIYIEQRFLVSTDVRAVGWVRGLLRDARGNVPPTVVMQRLGHAGPPPPPPAEIAFWLVSKKGDGAESSRPAVPVDGAES